MNSSPNKYQERLPNYDRETNSLFMDESSRSIAGATAWVNLSFYVVVVIVVVWMMYVKK